MHAPMLSRLQHVRPRGVMAAELERDGIALNSLITRADLGEDQA
jgi:hypothetical protein